MLGKLDAGNAYHAAVKAAASDEVIFPGAIYDKTVVQALRFHARAYCHGHTVGGTNPSLVESLWCGNAVLAHRNRFNQWTAGAEQFFFADTDECERMIERILTDDIAVARAGRMARLRAAADFVWADILSSYERELAALGGYAARARLGRSRRRGRRCRASADSARPCSPGRHVPRRGLGALAMPAIVRAAQRARPLRLRRGMNLWPWFSLTREFPATAHRLRLAAVQADRAHSDARRSRGAALRRHRLRAPAGRSRAAAGVLRRPQRERLFADIARRDRALQRRIV